MTLTVRRSDLPMCVAGRYKTAIVRAHGAHGCFDPSELGAPRHRRDRSSDVCQLRLRLTSAL